MQEGRPFAELIRGLPGTPFGDWRAVRVRGIATDSRQVEPGDLFVALPGTQRHGAAFVAEAARRGAAAVVIPTSESAPAGLAGLRHPAPEAALADLAARFYRHPSHELTVVGVTGTNGKTTTALLLTHLLRAAGWDPAAWTTTLVSGAGPSFRPVWTTPPAHRLERFLRTAADLGRRAAVLEVSSHGVALGRVRCIRFRAGVGTNVSPDHLDFHGSLEAYVAAKRAFFAALGPGALAVLNAGDPVVLGFERATRATVLTYGVADRAERADLQAADLRLGRMGSEFMLLPGPRLCELAPAAARELPAPANLPLPGRHNVENALAALGAALGLGLPLEPLLPALSTAPPPPRRLETRPVGPYLVVNDVAMNEASYDTALATVAAWGARGLVVVNALRGARGAEVNAAAARVLARWNRRLGFAPLIVTASQGELARDPVDHRVREAELAAFVDTAKREGLGVSLHEELAPAVAEAVGRLPRGGVLLLLGTFGMDEGPALAVAMLERRLGLPPSAPPSYPPAEDR